MVDEQYINKLGDNSYKVGQRIVISCHDVDVSFIFLRQLKDG